MRLIGVIAVAFIIVAAAEGGTGLVPPSAARAIRAKNPTVEFIPTWAPSGYRYAGWIQAVRPLGFEIFFKGGQEIDYTAFRGSCGIPGPKDVAFRWGGKLFHSTTANHVMSVWRDARGRGATACVDAGGWVGGLSKAAVNRRQSEYAHVVASSRLS